MEICPRDRKSTKRCAIVRGRHRSVGGVHHDTFLTCVNCVPGLGGWMVFAGINALLVARTHGWCPWRQTPFCTTWFQSCVGRCSTRESLRYPPLPAVVPLLFFLLSPAFPCYTWLDTSACPVAAHPAQAVAAVRLSVQLAMDTLFRPSVLLLRRMRHLQKKVPEVWQQRRPLLCGHCRTSVADGKGSRFVALLCLLLLLLYLLLLYLLLLLLLLLACSHGFALRASRLLCGHWPRYGDGQYGLMAFALGWLYPRMDPAAAAAAQQRGDQFERPFV